MRPLLNLYDSLKQVNGVYESAYQAVAEYRCDIPADRFSEWAAAMVAGRDIVELPMEIHFLDDAAYQRLLADAGVGGWAGAASACRCRRSDAGTMKIQIAL